MRVELADGVGLHVEELGEGPPLIVLHGGPGLDHTTFRPYLDPLSENVRLLYMDERGQGRSDRVDPGTLSLEGFAQDVDRLAEALGLDASPFSATPSARSSPPSTRSSSAPPTAT